MNDPDKQLEWFLVDLRGCDSHEDVEALGRGELVSLLHRAPKLLDKILNLAKRDHKMLRCLSAARYYSGLGDDMCARIDSVIQQPFPKRQPPPRRRR